MTSPERPSGLDRVEPFNAGATPAVARGSTDGLVQAGEGAEIWTALRRHTPARIGLGRCGASLPTAASLAFSLAHAQARDGVHAALDAEALADALRTAGHAVLTVCSAAPDRTAYLRRPDLGRQLADDALAALAAAAPAVDAPGHDAVFVIADGLSARAAVHAVAVLEELVPALEGWRLAPVVVALQARVALGDPIAAALRARQVVMAIGERPGLSSPDSLGLYLTHAPRPGRTTDAERNCISNVRPQGLPCAAAATRLAWLMTQARRRRLTGVGLKDDSTVPAIPAG